ncbi:Protein of unknown function [Leuconostoc citreum LBAE C11]|nr:Protein of unknown function [Leuconostoc citreum LBAE C10]CCF27653.1 Protein of unknown function [Leuconostoc citreum LBAE C11]
MIQIISLRKTTIAKLALYRVE